MKKFTFYKILSVIFIFMLTATVFKSANIKNIIPETIVEAETYSEVNTVELPATKISKLNVEKMSTETSSIVSSTTEVSSKEVKVVSEPQSSEPKNTKKEETSSKPKSTEKEENTSSEVKPSRDAKGYSEWEIYEWAKIVYCEAGGESQKCREYVAQVVLNRINSSRFPNTVHGVIFQGKQFSPTFDGSWERKEPNQACYDAVYTVINASEPLTDALFFESCKGSSWHSRNLTEVAAIDNTRFYTY